jgi:hypothetical protein
MPDNGFYSALFNVANSDDSISPYRRLLITIRAIVRHLHKGTTNPSPIPLWVSGHSLGAGQAALLYHRFLTAPGDLGHDVVLRDCYAFGTPRTFNATGASAFEKLLNDEKNQGRNLFRFAHGSDPVAWCVRIDEDWDVTLRSDQGSRPVLACACALCARLRGPNFRQDQRGSRTALGKSRCATVNDPHVAR